MNKKDLSWYAILNTKVMETSTLGSHAQPYIPIRLLVHRFRASGLFRQALWMKHYGHMCLKRTLLWSTSPTIAQLDLGPIQKGIHKSLVKTADKYQDRNGKTRYKGTGKVLKGTQFLACSHKLFIAIKFWSMMIQFLSLLLGVGWGAACCI